MNARVAQLFGGRSGETTLASAATLYIPDNASVVSVTGTTTITALQPSDPVGVNRMVLFRGGTSTGSSTMVKFTNTNTTTAAYQMSLRGSDQTLTEGQWMALYFKTDRTWELVFIS